MSWLRRKQPREYRDFRAIDRNELRQILNDELDACLERAQCASLRDEGSAQSRLLEVFAHVRAAAAIDLVRDEVMNATKHSPSTTPGELT